MNLDELVLVMKNKLQFLIDYQMKENVVADLNLMMLFHNHYLEHEDKMMMKNYLYEEYHMYHYLILLKIF
jgi:hypothetical protein